MQKEGTNNSMKDFLIKLITANTGVSSNWLAYLFDYYNILYYN